MDSPNFNRLWETFIKIPAEGDSIVLSEVHDIIRSRISPLISRLRRTGMIGWYCFLIHNRHSGVPTSEDDDNPYFHIRLDFVKEVDPSNVLPRYCMMTRKVPRSEVNSIDGIDESLLKSEKVAEAWRLVGEQAAWLLELFSIHKEDVDVPPEQIGQFLHFYANMTCIAVR